MRCQCGASFCWICGQEIDDDLFPAHFQWWNPTGCANMQMNEAINPSLCARWCARLSACLQLMIIGPLTVLSTFLSTVLCCLCMYTSLRRELQDGTNRAANHYQRRANVTAHRSILLQPAEDFTEQFRARNQNCFTKWYFSPFQIAFRAQLSTCMSSWGMFWMFLLFALPLGLSGGSVVLALLIVVGLVVYPFYAASRLYQREYPWPDFVTQGCISTWRRVKRCFSCCCHYHALNRECRICCFICRPIHPPTDNQPTADGARSRQLSYRAPASYSRTHDANHNPDVDIELGMTKTTEAEESVHVTNDYETMQSRLDRMLRTLQDMENTLDRSEQQKKHLPLSQEDESDAEVNCKSENGEEVIVKQPQDADNNSSNSMFGLDHNPYSDQSSLSISNQELLRDLSEESTTFHDIQNALSTLLNEMMEAQV